MVFISGASLRFLPSSLSSSTHSSGNICSICEGISPEKIEFLAYCVAVGKIL
ncbi:secreted protein [gut metagenome]|uniref:Secreted protein n=1 Tax=gut metagenome TaxID=749906 RepID=J9FLI6_9ZZZZ